MSGFLDTQQKIPLKAILFGIAGSVAVTLLLMCMICGMVLISASVPYSMLPYILLIADAGGVFCGGYLAAAINKSRGLILGGIIGVIMFILLICAGLGTGEAVGWITLLKFFVMTVFGILGGIAGVNKKEKIRIK